MKKLFVLVLLCPYMILSGQQIEKEILPKWRLNIMGGMGYMTANADNAINEMVSYGINRKEAEDYYESMKLGVQGSVEIHYLFNRNLGVGAKYLLFSTNNSIDGLNMNMSPAGSSFIPINNATYAERLYINYAGPSFYVRQTVDPGNKWQLTGGISIGYTHYRNEVTIESETRYIPSLITGRTFGGSWDAGLEYFFNKNCSIGLNIGTFYSAFKKLKFKNELITTDVIPDKRENVSRLDFSLGIRFYK